MHSNESLVAETLLRASGYTARQDLERHSKIYVPVDQSLLPWGKDLGRYLLVEANRLAVLRILKQTLAPCHVALGYCKRTDAFSYTFNGVEYLHSGEMCSCGSDY